MPDITVASLNQKALLWARAGTEEVPVDDDYGRPKRSATFEEIDVRWERDKRDALLPDGRRIAVDVSLTVEQDIAVGSYVWMGSAENLWDSLTGTGTSTEEVPTSGLLEVVAFEKTPDLDAGCFYRGIGCKRFRGTMPEAE